MHNIAIVQLGFIKHKIDFQMLKDWQSDIFKVCQIEVCNNVPDGNGDWQTFLDDDLPAIVKRVAQSDFTIAITEYALEDNFFIRRIDDNCVAISLHFISDILENEHIPIENFILRNIYMLSIIYEKYNRDIPPSHVTIPDILHDETRSCIFDMCGLLADARYSSAQPCICSQCQAVLDKSQLDANTRHSLGRELKRIQKPLYYRISDFIKSHPIWALVITSLYGIILGVATNGIYDLVKTVFE